MFFKSRKEKIVNAEKRRGPRTGLYQASYFLPADSPEDSTMCECWFSNIGEGGIAIETKDNLLKEGDEIKILYRIGAKLRNDIIKVMTSRKRFNQYIYGCAFIEPDTERNAMINEYFKSEKVVAD